MCFISSIMLFLGWGILLAIPAVAQESPQPWQPVVAAVHVHSNLSTGQDSLDELARQAKAFGIDAVFLSDNFLLRYEYGLFPLRGLIRRTAEWPSVMQMGVGPYLQAVAEAGVRHPDVLLIPGMEVVPHYYWTGSVFTKDLTLHDTQRNLLVWGLKTEADYAGMPAAGNRAAYDYGWTALLRLSPAVLILPALWLLAHPASKMVGSGWTSVTLRHRRTVPAAVLLTLAGLLLINNFPFGTPPYDRYDHDSGWRPYQNLIGYVGERGGLTFWSMPEARDFTRYTFGRLGTVTVTTDPYPEALRQTAGFNGFGSVYQDTITVTDPGGLWDALLQDYMNGRRSRAPWGIGEVAYRAAGSAGTYLNSVETVLWVKDRTPAALLEALANGRSYALVRSPDYGLTLKEFSIFSATGRERAISGETLRTDGAVRIHVAVTATDGRPREVPIQVIRSGRLLAAQTQQVPFNVEYPDAAPSPGEHVYYRLLIGTPGHRIVANPIFVRR